MSIYKIWTVRSLNYAFDQLRLLVYAESESETETLVNMFLFSVARRSQIVSTLTLMNHSNKFLFSVVRSAGSGGGYRRGERVPRYTNRRFNDYFSFMKSDQSS